MSVYQLAVNIRRMYIVLFIVIVVVIILKIKGMI